MNEAEWAELERYVRDMADALGLKDWTLVLKHEPPEDTDAGAEFIPTDGRKVGWIRVHKDFRTYETETQRLYVLHELLHAHLHSVQEIVRVDLWDSRAISRDAYNLFFSGFRRHVEFAIDGISTAIAEKYPLIEWPEEGSEPEQVGVEVPAALPMEAGVNLRAPADSDC